MAKTFVSPQTGSTYIVVAEVDGFLVAYRRIDGGTRYRVRIQGSGAELPAVKQRLGYPQVWSDVKDGDHISCVVTATAENLAGAVADATRAVVLYTSA